MVLLRRQAREGERLFGIAVITGRVNTVRHVVADHAVLHALLVSFRQVLEDDGTDRFEHLAPIGRQRGKVLVDRFGLALNASMVPQTNQSSIHKGFPRTKEHFLFLYSGPRA